MEAHQKAFIILYYYPAVINSTAIKVPSFSIYKTLVIFCSVNIIINIIIII